MLAQIGVIRAGKRYVITYTIKTANIEMWEMITHLNKGGLNIKKILRRAPEKPPADTSVLTEDNFVT